MSIRIGVSKASGGPKFENYLRWLKGEDVETIDLMEQEDLQEAMRAVDALVLTGGCDIDPSRYDMPDAADVCADIDSNRDDREFTMLEIALEREIPVLAICRGLQVLNVHLGGTLIPHLPAEIVGSESHQKLGDADRTHTIEVTAGSLLHKGTGELEGEVNSAHHQAIGRLGEGLVASAKAEDGVIEAIEWLDSFMRPYLLGVQWHPERMPDKSSPFSKGLLDQFMFEVKSSTILERVSKPLPKEDPPQVSPDAPPEESNGLFQIELPK